MAASSPKRLLVVAVAGALLLGGAIVWFLLNRGRSVPEAQCEAVLAWLGDQTLEPSRVTSLPLPEALEELAADGQVHAERLEDGRLCFLLKRSIGYKDNFRGTFYCSAPFREADFYSDPAGGTAISIGSGPPIEELFVRSRLDPQRLSVYFDLN